YNAESFYWFCTILLRKLTGCDALTAMVEAPYVIPRELHTRWPFGPNANLSEIPAEYDSLKRLAGRIIRKTQKSKASRLMAFKEEKAFRHVPEERLRNYPFMSAYEIALDALAWRYKVLSGEAMKKKLSKWRRKIEASNKTLRDLDAR